jgi:uncharacterized protein
MNDPNQPSSAPPPERRDVTEAQRSPFGSQAFPPPPLLVHRAFIGPNGIRAGWRLLVFMGIWLLLNFSVGTLIHLVGVHSRGDFNPVDFSLREGRYFLVLWFSSWIMARLERRPLSDYGLPLRRASVAESWLGSLWGFFALTGLLTTIWLGHGFSFGGVALSGADLVYFAIAWAVAYVLVGFFEEFLFRGYALYTLATGIGFWPAAILLSTAFGAVHIHNPGEDWVGALSAFSIGLFWCFTVRRTGSLWFAIGLHASWDYSESFIYSVPDSGLTATGHLLNSSLHGPRWLAGGSVGPEGSVLVFVIILMMSAAFDRLYRDVKFPAVRASPNTGLSNP